MSRLISIIIPVYNVEEYLDRCMESVTGQTYKNIEIILSDDGSTDKSGKICGNWAAKDARVKVIHRENGGVSAARNEGFGASRGDEVIFVDPDDELEPEMLEKMDALLNETGADGVACGFWKITAEGKTKIFPEEGMLQGEEIMKAPFSERFSAVVWNKLFRRDVLIDGGGKFIGFEKGLYMAEDLLWLMRVLQGCGKIYCMEDAYYRWYRREGSALNSIELLSDKAMTELWALEKITEMCRPISRGVFRLSKKRLLGCLLKKVYAADERGDRAAAEKLQPILKRAVKDFPAETLAERLIICKAKLILLLKKIGAERAVVFVEKIG